MRKKLNTNPLKDLIVIFMKCPFHPQELKKHNIL